MTEWQSLKKFGELVKELKWPRVSVVEKKQHVFFDIKSKKETTLPLLGCLPLFLAIPFLLEHFASKTSPSLVRSLLFFLVG